MPVSPSVAPDEVARFSAQAEAWWQPGGPFQALHDLMPLRLAYVQEQVRVQQARRSLKGRRVLDVGCGGGLMAEALAQEGAEVTGLDASSKAIAVARAHAAASGLAVTYKEGTAEEEAASGASYDLVLALEILEHVADIEAFTKALATLVAPGGLLIVATINRTIPGFLLGVCLAEYVLGWVPPGTHDWNHFVKPSELLVLWEKQGLAARDCSGVVFNPLRRRFERKKAQASVNYFMTAQKES